MSDVYMIAEEGHQKWIDTWQECADERINKFLREDKNTVGTHVGYPLPALEFFTDTD